MSANKTIAGGRKSDSGGDAEQGSTGRKMTKGMKPGIGKPNGPGPSPFTKKMGSGRGHKLIDSKNDACDSGVAVDEWCQGKRSTYK